MSLAHRYRNFGDSNIAPEPVQELITEDIEDQKLQSFEQGFQAGWDDAVKAQNDATTKISSEFGQNLQDMSFTYQEALSKLTQSLEPVMLQMVTKLLPPLTQQALAAHVIIELQNLVKEYAGQPVEIVVASENAETIKELGQKNLSDVFNIIEEPSLGQGQAFVRIGTEEKKIDLDSVIFGISEALTAFFQETAQENTNE